MNIKIKALIIEDEDLIVQVLSKKLKSLGHAYDLAKTQEEATSYIKDFSYDYILLDLKIPIDDDDLDPDSINGFNLLLRIRENHSKENLPIIVMTAYEKNINTAVEAMKNGANDFLEKPFKSGELEDKITGVLRVKRSEVVLCLQDIPEKRKFQNYCSELVILPGDTEKEKPCRLGQVMVRFFYLTLNTKLQGQKWVNVDTMKSELNYDGSKDKYWFSKRIGYIKDWLGKNKIIQHFDFDETEGRQEIKIRTNLTKKQIVVKIIDYEKVKRETKV